MTHLALYALNLIAVSVLVFGLYYPRHRRRDLVVALLGVNVGVRVVAGALASSAVGAGLGLGLMGVLSIIRLRSTELGQREVAYYFTALALGLLGGLSVLPLWQQATLMGVVLAVMFIGDHPRLLPRARTAELVLDRAFTDEAALTAHVEQLLGGTVRGLTVRKVDVVNEMTAVEVRYELDAGHAAARAHARVRAERRVLAEVTR